MLSMKSMNFVSRYLVALLYITTQPGELWLRVPWGAKKVKGVKKFVTLFSYISWLHVMKFGTMRSIVE